MDYARDIKCEDDKGSRGARSSWPSTEPWWGLPESWTLLCLPSKNRSSSLLGHGHRLIGVTEMHEVAAHIHIKAATPQKGTPTSSWAVKIRMLQWLVTFSNATNINSYILDLWYEYFGISKNFLNRAPVAQGSAPRMNGWKYMKIKGLGTPK